MLKLSGCLHEPHRADVAGVPPQCVQAAYSGFPIARFSQIRPNSLGELGIFVGKIPQQAQEKGAIATQGSGGSLPVDAGNIGEIRRHGIHPRWVGPGMVCRGGNPDLRRRLGLK